MVCMPVVCHAVDMEHDKVTVLVLHLLRRAESRQIAAGARMTVDELVAKQTRIER